MLIMGGGSSATGNLVGRVAIHSHLPRKVVLTCYPGIIINSTPSHSGKCLYFDNKLYIHPTYKESLLSRVQSNEAENKCLLLVMVVSSPIFDKHLSSRHDTLSQASPQLLLIFFLSPHFSNNRHCIISIFILNEWKSL